MAERFDAHSPFGGLRSRGMHSIRRDHDDMPQQIVTGIFKPCVDFVLKKLFFHGLFRGFYFDTTLKPRKKVALEFPANPARTKQSNLKNLHKHK